MVIVQQDGIPFYFQNRNTDAKAVLDKKSVLAYSLTHMFGHLSEGISCVHPFILHAEDTIAFHLLTDVTTENKEQKHIGLCSFQFPIHIVQPS